MSEDTTLEVLKVTMEHANDKQDQLLETLNEQMRGQMLQLDNHIQECNRIHLANEKTLTRILSNLQWLMGLGAALFIYNTILPLDLVKMFMGE